MSKEIKKYLVVGFGRAGKAAARFLSSRGHFVKVTDSRGLDEFDAKQLELPKEIELELGGHRLESFLSADMIIASPGVPWIEEMRAARKAGVPIVDEAQLAAWEIKGDFIALTGTNGKSTTTVLLGKMLASTGRPVFYGGNLGNPLIECVEKDPAKKGGLVVAELSSFQLQRCPDLKPGTAVLLNLDEDHLDRHENMEEYAQAKAMIFKNQTRHDWALVNGNQEQCLSIGQSSRGSLLKFRDGVEVKKGGYLKGDRILVALPGRELIEISSEGMALNGRHNLKNALAASIVASIYGVSQKNIEDVLQKFAGLPHRMQRIGVHGGVVFYDDSKATNVSSAVGSLCGLEGRFVLIAGGKHKGSSYEPLKEVLSAGCDSLVLLGEAASLMESQLGNSVPDVVRVEDMKEAVFEAYQRVGKGNHVVLCPACSSYDMFENFEKRGEAFAEAVALLAKEEMH